MKRSSGAAGTRQQLRDRVPPAEQAGELAADTGRLAAVASDALPDAERAELSRQGAKAAARGESHSTNPLNEPLNAPVATGESQERWTERSDAWLAGHAFETARDDEKSPDAPNERQR